MQNMFWLPVAGQPGANGAAMGPYSVSMMPQPGMVPVQAAGTPPGTGLNAQHLIQHSGGPAGQSGDFSATATAPSTPPHLPMAHLSASGAFAATPSGSMAGSATADPRPVYVMSGPGGMQMGYPQMLPSGYIPVSQLPLMPSGNYYPMTMYPALSPSVSGDFGASPSGPFFVPAVAPPPQPTATAGPGPLQSTSGVFSAQPSGDFGTAVSFGSIPPAFSGTFAPQASSGCFYSDASGDFRQSANGRGGRTGDAGRGYEAGVYYEGRVKRFNPVRGYGFLSATHKLLKLKDVKEATAAAAAAAAAKAASANSLSVNESACLTESRESSKAEHQQEKEKKHVLGMSDNEKANATNVRTATSEASAQDVPLINVIPVSAPETDPAIDMTDIVVIKGEEYVRKPVVMGDIFVHYHCLQRTAAELESELSGALVNLPAGARVQFKAEVFVPARLMEEAQDSKQAAAMLNNIGIPVEEDPNLLAGAIATKKGWGYQAMNVVQLPSQPTNNRLGSRRGNRGRACSVGNASTASRSSVNSARHSNAPSQGKGEHDEDSNALAPCSGRNLKIHVDVEGAVPPPPSFESATAGMQFTMPAPSGLVYYPTYTATMPR